ncbi:hypothetical protein VPH35_083152 [Triticum aestivum]
MGALRAPASLSSPQVRRPHPTGWICMSQMRSSGLVPQLLLNFCWLIPNWHLRNAFCVTDCWGEKIPSLMMCSAGYNICLQTTCIDLCKNCYNRPIFHADVFKQL